MWHLVNCLVSQNRFKFKIDEKPNSLSLGFFYASFILLKK